MYPLVVMFLFLLFTLFTLDMLDSMDRHHWQWYRTLGAAVGAVASITLAVIVCYTHG